jgi:hypothetical protein
MYVGFLGGPGDSLVQFREVVDTQIMHAESLYSVVVGSDCEVRAE